MIIYFKSERPFIKFNKKGSRYIFKYYFTGLIIYNFVCQIVQSNLSLTDSRGTKVIVCCRGVFVENRCPLRKVLLYI